KRALGQLDRAQPARRLLAVPRPPPRLVAPRRHQLQVPPAVTGPVQRVGVEVGVGQDIAHHLRGSGFHQPLGHDPLVRVGPAPPRRGECPPPASGPSPRRWASPAPPRHWATLPSAPTRACSFESPSRAVRSPTCTSIRPRPPPCFSALLERAASTRLRRMA